MLRNSGKLVGRLITASGNKSFPVAALELSGAGSSVFFAQLTALSRCLAVSNSTIACDLISGMLEALSC